MVLQASRKGAGENLVLRLSESLEFFQSGPAEIHCLHGDQRSNAH